MEYITKEAFTAHATALIKGYKDLKTICKAIDSTAAEMNGKIYNKRFRTAVDNKIDGVGYLHEGNYSCVWEMYLINRSYQDTPRTAKYFDADLRYTRIYGGEKFFIEGRICADAIHADMMERCELIDAQINKLQDAINNYDTHAAAVKKAVMEFREKMKAINPVFVPSELKSYELYDSPLNYAFIKY